MGSKERSGDEEEENSKCKYTNVMSPSHVGPHICQKYISKLSTIIDLTNHYRDTRFWHHIAAAPIEHLVRLYLAPSHPILPYLLCLPSSFFALVILVEHFFILAMRLIAGYCISVWDGKPIFLAIRVLFDILHLDKYNSPYYPV